MTIVTMFGEMWTRNFQNIQAVPKSKKGGRGVYVLYDGSMPMYIGKGNIQSRIRSAHRSKTRGRQWNYFSWYAMNDQHAIHDMEVILLRSLPFYLRIFNRQRGKFWGAKRQHEKDEKPAKIRKIKAFGRRDSRR